MKKYELQLRQPQQKRPPRPPLLTALGFGGDEDDDVEKDITLQAAKNKSLKDVITNPFQSLFFFYFFFIFKIEERQKKASEEDPSVFYYDGVHDE
jgi:coiled-coil domain-containing protein 55